MTVSGCDDLPGVLVRLEEVVIGGELGRLAQLGGQRVDELRHQAGGRVVGLTEVVGHHLAPQGHLLLTHLLPLAWASKAAPLHQGEEDGSLARAGTSSDDDSSVGGEVGDQRLLDILPQPVSSHEPLSSLTSNLEIKRLRQLHCRVGESGEGPPGHLLPPPRQSAGGGAGAGLAGLEDRVQSGPLGLGPGQAGLVRQTWRVESEVEIERWETETHPSVGREDRAHSSRYRSNTSRDHRSPLGASC